MKNLISPQLSASHLSAISSNFFIHVDELFRLTLFAGIALCLLLAAASAARAQGAPVPVGLAQFAATEIVHDNNPPFAWNQAAARVLYNADGIPAAHAFLFAKADSPMDGADIAQHILAAKARNADPDSLHAFNNIACVIIGARDESRIVLRHFRGIPDFWIAAVELDAAQSGSGSSARVLMLNPMDFRVASLPAPRAPLRLAPQSAPAPLDIAAGTATVDPASGKKESVRSIRKSAQKRAKQNQKELSAVEPDLRDAMRAAQEEAAADRRSRWQAKRDAWEAAQSQGGQP